MSCAKPHTHTDTGLARCDSSRYYKYNTTAAAAVDLLPEMENLKSSQRVVVVVVVLANILAPDLDMLPLPMSLTLCLLYTSPSPRD